MSYKKIFGWIWKISFFSWIPIIILCIWSGDLWYKILLTSFVVGISSVFLLARIIYKEKERRKSIVANMISKEFKISMSDAIDTINQGFARGLDINGEYLENLQEYATLAKEARLTIKQFQDLLQTPAKRGIFSDKGIDVVKESVFQKRLKEEMEKDD